MYCRVCPHRAQSPVGEMKSNLLSAIKEIVSGHCDRSRGRAGGKDWARRDLGRFPRLWGLRKGRQPFHKKERVFQVIVETMVGWQEVRLARWGGTDLRRVLRMKLKTVHFIREVMGCR